MSDGIFVLNGEQLVELTVQPYETEDDFQAILAKHPNLLAGGQMNRAEPRRWLLISREVSVPGEQDGGGRWSLDHLFLDQDAIPTLVEVKRSSDTRIRREVVGQLLDYAANAVAYWPVEKMRAEYETSCEARGVMPEQEIERFIGQAGTVDQFWEQAKTNLQAGKIRLVFVADIIPPELQRIVEFLNKQMDPAEVLAVEIKQYTGPGLKTLVPRVIGQTIEAGPRDKRSWDETSLLSAIDTQFGTGTRNAAAAIIQWAKNAACELRWGEGTTYGSVTVGFTHRDFSNVLFTLYSLGRVALRMKRLKRVAPFDAPSMRQELLDRLAKIHGVSMSGDLLDGEPAFDLAALESGAAREQFFSVMNWLRDEIVRR
ncbi:MAG: hypothetical protein JSS27_01555 [Planctomycetes bacterium]|nr:hypothetical protein [Planctomycetota bacterium]